VGGGLCDINSGMGDLVWGTIGRHGGVFFSDIAPFFGRERPGRREKIRLDLKNYNAPWSL